MKTNLHSMFATSSTAEQEGVWVPVCEGVEVKLARMGNPRFAAVYKKKCKPHLASLRRGLLDKQTEVELMRQTLAEAVVLDWRGLRDAEGNLVPYSSETALQLLTDLPDFADFVADESRKLENYRESTLAESEKN